MKTTVSVRPSVQSDLNIPSSIKQISHSSARSGMLRKPAIGKVALALILACVLGAGVVGCEPTEHEKAQCRNLINSKLQTILIRPTEEDFCTSTNSRIADFRAYSDMKDAVACCDTLYRKSGYGTFLKR